MIDKKRLLEKFSLGIIGAARSGVFGGKPVSIEHVETVAGPRAGALLIHAGLDSARLVKSLSAEDCATLRQFVSWDFPGEPACYMSGRAVRVEAGWPDDLAEKSITLASLGKNPRGAGRWIGGKNETGATVTLGLNDSTPHFLVAGSTGSGKTVALQSAIVQLAADSSNKLILADGKFGSGFHVFDNLAGLVGPVCDTIEMTRAALSWAACEMTRRYQSGGANGRLILVVDEVQEFSVDTQSVDFLRRIVAQGRGVNVHCLLGTQYPLASIFGDSTIKRNLVGRVALRTTDFTSSQVAIGASTPRADRLLGQGDAYCVTPGNTHRTQIAFIPKADLAALPRVNPELETWPEVDLEGVGNMPETPGAFSGEEVAVSIVTAHVQKGRPFLVAALKEAGLQKPGSDRAARLLKVGRDAHNWLLNNGFTLCNDVVDA